MLDFVLNGAAISLAGVSPIVLGYKTRFGTVCGQARFLRGYLRCELAIASGRAPAIRRGPHLSPVQDHIARHRNCNVRLVVNGSCNERDCAARYQLANERDTVARLAVVVAAHVHAQVHLLEVSMKWNCKAANPRVQEAESHDAEKRVPPAEVEFGACWDVRLQERGINVEVDHYKMAPFRREKWLFQ